MQPRIVGVTELQRCFRNSFDQVWDRLGKLNSDFSEEEIAADIKAARLD